MDARKRLWEAASVCAAVAARYAEMRERDATTMWTRASADLAMLAATSGPIALEGVADDLTAGDNLMRTIAKDAGTCLE